MKHNFVGAGLLAMASMRSFSYTAVMPSPASRLLQGEFSHSLEHGIEAIAARR